MMTIAIENDVRGLLRTFGLKVGIVGLIGFDIPASANLLKVYLMSLRLWNLLCLQIHAERHSGSAQS